MNTKELLIVMLALIQSMFACSQQSYDQKLASLYKDTVPLIKPNEVKSKMDSTAIYLLDTRSKKEFEVSHLPGARYVGYDDFKLEDVKQIPKDAEVVLYCSVGYRSERVGEKMLQAGFKNVYNLYGGIFEWKNTGKDVVNPNGNKTDSVHTYNRRWGKWLEDNKGIKVYD